MTGAVPGWHGKLPTVSDFAGRRLDPRFVELWDDAVSASLAALREAKGERWVADYLACPTWRFLIDAGVLAPPFDASAWGGVLMPSVDRVGRYYPLILACPLCLPPDDNEATKRVWHWLEALEQMAIDALEADWTIDQLETALARLGAPTAAGECAADGEADGASLAVEMSSSASSFLGAAPALVLDMPACRWYSRSAEGAEKVLSGRGLGETCLQLWTANLEHA